MKNVYIDEYVFVFCFFFVFVFVFVFLLNLLNPSLLVFLFFVVIILLFYAKSCQADWKSGSIWG